MQIEIMTNNEENVCYFHLKANERREREEEKYELLLNYEYIIGYKIGYMSLESMIWARHMN